MKRILASLAAVVVLTAFLSGCVQKEPAGENIVFTGVIEQINDSSILVSTTDDVSFDKASVSYADNMEGLDFNLIIGQMVKLTILPQIAESYPVQVKAVKIELVSEPALSDPEHPNFTASFFRADSYSNNSQEYIMANAENADKLIISSARHLPVFLIDDAAALNDFISAGSEHYQFDVEYGEDGSFADAVKKYDDSFFAENRLLIVYVQEPSGSIRHEIKDVAINDGTLMVTVGRKVPEVGTDDMADWFIVLEFSKVATAKCTGWDAVAE
ncbi:hypothetical protein SDC9_136186 [bioreactor metagenome]|uniref:Uncharacterized protein n=1 Tax=bioreactor metagenome TaxID=1076179 RepID=A0A645DJ66_9ZZZZ